MLFAFGGVSLMRTGLDTCRSGYLGNLPRLLGLGHVFRSGRVLTSR